MRKVIVSAILIILILFAMTAARQFTRGYAPWLDTLVSYITYPVVVIDYVLISPVNTLRALVKDRLTAETELRNVEEERQTLLARVIELESTVSTQQELEEICLFKKRYQNSSATAAQVICVQSTPHEQTIMVDIGSSRGVTPDMVAVYKNCIIGRVAEVYPHMSRIILITDPRCKIAAYCPKTGARGIHEGANLPEQTTLSFVSHLQKIQDGDLVLSSGEGLVFPRGFGIGRITSYTLNGLNYTITVSPLIDLRTIHHCILIQKGAEYREEEVPTPPAIIEKPKPVAAHPVRVKRKAPEPEVISPQSQPVSQPTQQPEIIATVPETPISTPEPENVPELVPIATPAALPENQESAHAP